MRMYHSCLSMISVIIPLVGLYLGRGIGKEYRKDLEKTKGSDS